MENRKIFEHEVGMAVGSWYREWWYDTGMVTSKMDIFVRALGAGNIRMEINYYEMVPDPPWVSGV